MLLKIIFHDMVIIVVTIIFYKILLVIEITSATVDALLNKVAKIK